MNSSDISYLFQWWGLLGLIGILFYPFTSKIFSPMYDKGYVFSKVIGILIISYIVFFLGVIKLVPFSQVSSVTIALLTGLSFFFFNSKRNSSIEKPFLTPFRSCWKSILVEEIIFLLTLCFWAYVRSFQPDIYGLEKYMDFGFVNSILRSDFFPPKDMWFTPYAINYYYFGHLMTAVLTKISGIPSFITYNLMLATLFAFCFTLSYSFLTNILFILQTRAKKHVSFLQRFSIFIVGLISASLVTLGGNLHILYIFFTPYNTEHPVFFSELIYALKTVPNAYWYPNATRFIFNTIHEFPIYSFVVSDLHGHVLGISIVLTIMFFLFSLFLQKRITVIHLFFLSFLLATAYMTNAWDGGIYLLLSALIIITIEIQKKQHKKIPHLFAFIKESFTKEHIINSLYYIMITIAGFFLLTIPFSIHFQTGALVHGIGVVCAPQFLTNIGHVGPFLFEADHCQKSPFWQLLILYGFFYFFVLSFSIFLFKIKSIKQTDIFIGLLMILATVLIIFPEFFYVKDIYPAHYRANTMFKLVYEAFILLSLTSGYTIYRISKSLQLVKLLGKISIISFLLVSSLLVCLVLTYPYFAISSYYNNLSFYKGLNGTQYLKTLHPDDFAAITWINASIIGQPIIAEAQGDSYTDYGRISTNTGLPTILGWTVHEWLWRGTYDIPAPRITQVQDLYETKDIQKAKGILRTYNVSYVFIGDLERTKYPKLSEDKFKRIGKVVYSHGNTKIYKITDAFAKDSE